MPWTTWPGSSPCLPCIYWQEQPMPWTSLGITFLCLSNHRFHK
jgi:hypothetical protein